MDQQEEEFLKEQRTALMHGRCPWSGLPLSKDGEGLPGSLSCSVCDCFGYRPEEVW